MTNKKFWQGLPPDIRGELTVAMKEAIGFANEVARKDNEAALEAIRKSGRRAAV